MQYPDLSPYSFVANNPIKYIDSHGDTIVIPNVKDREPILKMINARAKGVFGINDKGQLYVKNPNGAEGYSGYYRDRLIQAINSERTISIGIEQKVKIPHLAEDGKTLEEGKTEIDVDTRAGGGVTFGYEGTDQQVFISGNENKNLKDTEGNTLTDGPEEILMHELVGHAIPAIVGSDTGNAVQNENKARAEFSPGKNQQRAPEPSHKETNKSPKVKK